MSRCCKIQSFCVTTLSPAKSLSLSSAEELLFEIEPPIMHHRNLEWIEGIGDGTSGWTDAFETEKGVVFIDLPLTMSTDRDLSVLNSRPAQVKVESKVHGECKECTKKVKFELQKLWWSLGLGPP